MKITIFHTNDIHGRLDALTRLSQFARRMRAASQAAGEHVFFWDAGDAADRRYEIFSMTKGWVIGPLLSAAGVTLQTVGNALTLPYGPQVLAEIASRAGFPLLAANLRDGDGPLVPGVTDHVLIPLDGNLNMGVFGLTAPWGNAYETFGLRLPDFFAIAHQQVEALQAAGAWPIILLSHLGLEDDRLVANSVPGIDLIIGAHSHNLLPEGEFKNGVLITQAGDYGQALGKIELTLDAVHRKIQDMRAQVFMVPEDEQPDPLLVKAIAWAQEEVERLKATPIGTLTAPLEAAYFTECSLGDLAADMLKERMSADVALLASGHFHTSLPDGTLTIGDLNKSCFSSANPGVTTVRGEQIWMALERGLDPGLAEFEHGGFRGTPVGMPQISGLRVEFEPQAEIGQKIQQIWFGEVPLDPKSHYRVAHTDAETMPEYGYLILDADQQTDYEVPTIIGEALTDYIRAHSPIQAPPARRWNLIAKD